MIEIKNVSKNFGTLKALDDVSFSVEKGDIFGVIGQNGAGKSTLFRCLMDFFDDYTGSITYEEKPISKIPLEKIGFLPEERSLSQKKSIQDEIRYFARLNQMNNLTDDLLESRFNRFEIKGKLTDKIKELSKGNQQKVQLLAAIIYNPEFVILDEPLSGLDPYNIALLQDIIREINEKGTTILFSSHNMENVESLCNKLLMIKNGKIVLDGSPAEIRNAFPRLKLIIETDKNLPEILGEFMPKYTRNGDIWTLHLENEQQGIEIYNLISGEIGYVPQFSQAALSLNEVFARKVEEI